ncbi:MAG: hypothetical protein U0414_14125 [Polyangiaceae bacterium]
MDRGCDDPVVCGALRRGEAVDPPAKVATDLQALAALLLELASGDKSSKTVALLGRAAKGDGVTTPIAFVEELRAAAEVERGRVLLADLVASMDGPTSHTQIGLGLGGAAKKAAPQQHTLPRVEQRGEASPATARFGFLGDEIRPAGASLDAEDDDSESDATIVEPLAAFDVKADDKTPMARVPAAQIPLAKPGPRPNTKPMASTMPGTGAPGEKPKPKGAVTPAVAVLKAPAEAAAGSPAARVRPAGSTTKPYGGTEKSPAGRAMARPASSADEKTPIAMDIPTAAGSMRGRLERELHGEEDEEDGSTVVAPLWSEAMARATRDDDAGDSSSNSATRRRDRLAAQRQAGAKGPKVVAIPKTPPVPAMRASNPGEKTPMIGNLPVLWSDEAAPDSEAEEQATIASALVPTPASSGPLVSYAMEQARIDDDESKNPHEVTTARGPVHRPEGSRASAPDESAPEDAKTVAAPIAAAPSAPVPEAKPLTKNTEPTPARGTQGSERGKLPIAWMVAAFVVAALLVVVIAFAVK